MLTDADLAFMRETQAEARPTEAALVRRKQGTSASGGRTDSWLDPDPVRVRLNGNPERVPPNVVGVLAGGSPVEVTMDLVEVRSGDIIRVSPVEEYQVVTDGDPSEWATAQVVWAKRTKVAPR